MTKKLAFSSVMTALIVVCLYASAVAPTAKLAFLAVTSLCILITVAQCGTRYALVAYIAASLAGLLLIPSKAQVLLFLLFLGYYPIIKRYIERLDNLFFEWIVKILFFSAVLIVAYFLIKYLLLSYVSLGALFDYVLSHLVITTVVAEIAFIIYDYFLSLLVSYYVNIIQKRFKLG